MDNIKGSVDLLNDLEVNSADKDGLLKEIDDIKQAGNEVSVTSVLNRYDKDNNLVSQTVGIRNETTERKYIETLQYNMLIINRLVKKLLA